MSQLVKATAIVLGMLVFSGIGFAQCKIVVVDMQEAVTGSNEGKAASAKFDTKTTEWQGKLDKIKADLDTAQKKFDTQKSLASGTVLASLQKAVTDKQTELQRSTEDAQKEVDNYRDELLGPIMMTAQMTLEGLATEKTYSVVYDISVPNSPIIYSSKECDVTTEVKTRMNAKSGVAAPASTAAPASGSRGAAPAATSPAPARGGTGTAAPASPPASAPRGTPPATPAPAPAK